LVTKVNYVKFIALVLKVIFISYKHLYFSLFLKRLIYK